MARSDKLYGDSPKMERDGDGKVAVKKGAASKEKPKSDMANMHDRHARETNEAHKRHEDEIKALHARHEKEAAAMPPPGDAGQVAAGAPGAEDTGATAGV